MGYEGSVFDRQGGVKGGSGEEKCLVMGWILLKGATFIYC